MRRTLLISVVSALALGAFAQDSARIEWKPTEGHKTALRVTVNAEVMGAAVEAKLRSDSTVLKVNADGTVVIESTERMESLLFNGQEMEGAVLGEATKSKVVMKRNGELVSMETDDPNSNARLNDAQVFLFPEREVKKGETWTRIGKADATKGVRASKTVHTHLGSETLDGELAHKVKMEYTETEGATPITFTATVWVAASNGDVIRVEGKMENVEFAPGAPPTSATIRIERIKT